jgi:hypothetical protein
MLKEENNSLGSSVDYNSPPAAVQMRLDTKELLEKIEIFLRGGHITYFYADNADGERELCSEFVESGKKMCNSFGVQTLVNWICGVLNPHVVQGNFWIDPKTGISRDYDNYIKEFNIDLISLIVIKRVEWDVSISDVEGISDFIMSMVIPFMTRLIDNKERESYGTTIRTVENTSVSKGKSNPFGLGGGK